MTRQHRSAHQIGEHAVLKFDHVENLFPLGVVVGIEFVQDDIYYNVGMFLDDGQSGPLPNIVLHAIQPLKGVSPNMLTKCDSAHNYIKRQASAYRAQKNTNLPRAEFQMGDIVGVRMRAIAYPIPGAPKPPLREPLNKASVLITGVTYHEGKVLYDVCFDDDAYDNINSRDSMFGRRVSDEIFSVDSIYLTKPMPRRKASVTIDADNGVTIVAPGDVKLNVPSIDIDHNC